MNATDIIGYAYAADIYCNDCILDAALADSDPWLSRETNLDRAASARDIDRYDESSYDSDEFPKVIFVSDVQQGDTCGSCHDELIES